MKRRFVSRYGLVLVPTLLILGCGGDPETTPDTTPPLAPELSGASKEAGSVGVSWVANTEPDLDGYYVYVSENGIPRQVNPLPLKETNTVVEVDNSAGAVAIWLTAIDFSGNESSPSNTAWAFDENHESDTHEILPSPRQW